MVSGAQRTWCHGAAVPPKKSEGGNCHDGASKACVKLHAMMKLHEIPAAARQERPWGRRVGEGEKDVRNSAMERGPSPTKGVHGYHPMKANYSSDMGEKPRQTIFFGAGFPMYGKTESAALGGAELLTVYTQQTGWWMRGLTWNASIGVTGGG